MTRAGAGRRGSGARRSLLRAAAAGWLLAWSVVGLPWRSFTWPPSAHNVRLVPLQDGRPVSHLLNVLAFVPWGVLGGGLGWPVRRVALSAAGISAGTEFLQLFSSRRYPSVTDLLMNTAGAALGAGILAARRRTVPAPGRS